MQLPRRLVTLFGSCIAASAVEEVWVEWRSIAQLCVRSAGGVYTRRAGVEGLVQAYGTEKSSSKPPGGVIQIHNTILPGKSFYRLPSLVAIISR